MITIDSFLSYIHPSVPDAPRGIIRQWVMEAIQDISKIRGTMLMFLEPMTLHPEQDYIALDDSYYADELICVKVNDCPVSRLPESCSAGSSAVWYLSGDDDQTGGDQLWFKGLGNSTRKKPRKVCVTIDYKEVNPERIPDYIFRDYKEAVYRFVLWHLMEMPGKAWTSQPMSANHRLQWYQERRTIQSNAMLRLYANNPRAIVPVNDFSAAGRGTSYGGGGIFSGYGGSR